MSSSSPSSPDNANVTVETGKWTRFLPESFGIRETVRQSPLRWCVRESVMWGIATGTAMSLHRLRMGSHPHLAVNVGFLTTLLVASPSYFFCYRRRERKQEMISIMMRANDFDHARDMPEDQKNDASPFLGENNGNTTTATATATTLGEQEYRARIQERKDWQTPIPGQQDPKDIFKPVSKDN